MSAVSAMRAILAAAVLFVPCVLGIWQGQVTKDFEFPFVAHLRGGARVESWWNRQSLAYGCAGSIVSPNIVLTAGHCVHNLPGTQNGDVPVTSFEVSVGVGDGYSAPDGYKRQTRKIKHIFVHEGYNDELKPVAVYNDVALLVLNFPLEFNRYVQPIRVPDADQVFEVEGQILGWGSKVILPFNSAKLKKAAVKVLARAECKTQFLDIIHGNDTEIPETGQKLDAAVNALDHEAVICVNSHNGSQPCKGDSGGPAICYANNQPYVCGIMSWILMKADLASPNNCGFPQTPTVCTAVANFSTWVNAKISQFNFTCEPKEFSCGEGTCISQALWCDGKPDCPAGTDELFCDFNCGNKYLCPKLQECTEAGFICGKEKEASTVPGYEASQTSGAIIVIGVSVTAMVLILLSCAAMGLLVRRAARQKRGHNLTISMTAIDDSIMTL